jgi:hypothetical protein
MRDKKALPGSGYTPSRSSLRVFLALSLAVVSLPLLASCQTSRKKEKPIYSYQLPWSGNDLVRSMTVPLPHGKDFDGSARLVAYLEARRKIKDLYIQAIRSLPLAENVSVGQVMDRKPAVLKRVEKFLDHARVRTVAYHPGQGLYIEEVAYLGSDFQSLLGVTLHLVPHKKKEKRGANTAKAGGGGSPGGGGMPMMPMMP